MPSEGGSSTVPGLLAIAGALLGQVEQRLARQDCRTAWAVGHPVSIAGIALSYMPAGERGAIRIRPTAPPAEGCRWVGPIRVWTDGPAIPGTVYRVDGTWRPARYLRSARRPPERWGWVAVDSMIPLRPARVREHPILMARGATAEGIWRVYPRRWAPLAEALILGQRAMVSHEVSERLARSGLAHLLAISGLHVGLLAIAFFCLARAARLPSKGAHVCTVVCVFAYVLLIGAPASAVRAALIILLWTLSRLAGRASSPYDTLGLAAIIIILMKPWSVVEPGFQLSFAGACAVGFAHSEVRRFSWLRSRPSVVRALALGMAASTAAVLLTAPITVRYFGHVALAAIIGNLVAIPLLGLTMPALFTSALLSPWAPLAAWPASAAVVLLRLIDGLAGFLSGIQWASLDLPPPNDLATLCYVVLLILAAHTLHGAWYRQRSG